MQKTILHNPPHLACPAHVVYLNLVCDWDEMERRLATANQAIVAGKAARPAAQPQPLRLTRASLEMTRAKLNEVMDGPGSWFAMYQTDTTLDGALLLRAAKALSRHLGSAGIGEFGDQRFSIGDFGDIEFDVQGRVTRCMIEPALGGKHVLAVVAAFVQQDFGVVLRVGGSLRYGFDCSAFEKTPKDIENGYNHFVGLDFLEWHRRIPLLGEPLVKLFSNLDDVFSRGALDLFTIDLKGRNVYTDGTLRLLRHERDYVLPLHLAEGDYLGFVNFADVFMKDVNEHTAPQEGGSYYEVGCPRRFHDVFQVVKTADFRPHPTGMRPANVA